MVVKHNESIYFDRILYKQNVAGSIAFAQSNAKADILTLEEFEKLEQSFREVEKEHCLQASRRFIYAVCRCSSAMRFERLRSTWLASSLSLQPVLSRRLTASWLDIPSFSALSPSDGAIRCCYTDSLLLAIWRGLGRSSNASTGIPWL